MTPGLAGFIADGSDPQTWDDITSAVLSALAGEFGVVPEPGATGAGTATRPAATEPCSPAQAPRADGSGMPTPTPRSTSTTPQELWCQDVETSGLPGLRSVNPRAPLNRDATGASPVFRPRVRIERRVSMQVRTASLRSGRGVSLRNS